ncbi:MAG: right-handed parallel beta-helix repeat-containing protein [Pseudomonadota bacterium]
MRTLAGSKRILFILLIALCAQLDFSHAADYFVATDGDNDDPGTVDEPWLTLQHAADHVQAGDTVTVAAGQYDGFELTTSGTAGQRIVFRGEDGARPEVISNAPGRTSGINLEGASFLTIEGFEVNGRDQAGIRAVLCANVTIRDNHTDLNQIWGIFTGFCDNLLIENNVTTNSRVEHGIYVSNSGDRPVIRDNLIVGNARNGIHMNGDLSAGGDGVISDALVERNVIINNGGGSEVASGGGSGINMDGVQNSLTRNNLIYDSRASGISLYRIDGGQPSTGNRVLNNTVLVASDGRWALNIQNASSNNTVRNNILLNDHPFRGSMDLCAACLADFDSDHNVVMDRFTDNGGSSVQTLGQWQQSTGQEGQSLVATEVQVFAQPAGNDYRLSIDSPAVDAGELLIDVPADIEGIARPQFFSHDIGAYELPDLSILFRDRFED